MMAARRSCLPLLLLALNSPASRAFAPGLAPPTVTHFSQPSSLATRPSCRNIHPLSPPTLTRSAAHAITRKIRSSSTSLYSIMRGVKLKDLLFDSTSTAFDAWEWTNCLGAPAALVAGAVLVTLSETRSDMAPRRRDKHWIRIVKQLTRFLLLSSFALEVSSIFVSTMTGTVLLSHGETAKATVGYACPLGLLHHHFEFEYLTIQIGFLQGLINWLGAVACEVAVPKQGETVSARRMNGFMTSCLITLIFWILAFYNHHLSFYSDYLSMLARYGELFVKRFFGRWRPMSVLYGPSTVITAVLGWRAFKSRPDLDDD